jgi:hypothetical protein
MWAIRLSAATVVDPYWEPTKAFVQMLFWRKIFEDGSCPSLGLFAAPYLEFLELSLVSYVILIEKNILPLSPGQGLNPRSTHRVLRCENRKI